MSPSELESVYNDLSQVPQQTAEQAIGQLGQQQAAQGPSAAAMGASGGYGIGNYTYNRLVDPTVQQLSTQLVSTGRSQALNRAISLALSQAQENYRNAYNSYANRPSGGGGSGSGSGSGNGGNGTITGVDETVTEEMTPTNDVTGLGPIFATDGAQGVWDVGNDWVGIDTSKGGTVVPNIFGGVTEADKQAAAGAKKDNGRKFESAQAVKDYLENEIQNGYNGPLFFV